MFPKDLPGLRRHGISLVTIRQDSAQIEGIYGRRASTVLNNHRAKIFGTGIADPQTLDYVGSYTCGRGTRIASSTP